MSTATAMRFNPRSPCGERPGSLCAHRCSGAVSTHAPLAGSDVVFDRGLVGHDGVSTHAPLAGSDHGRARYGAGRRVSTHAPLAGSDVVNMMAFTNLESVSTHAPLAGSDEQHSGHEVVCLGVSTHAPLAGSDLAVGVQAVLFLVSTHAPLAGSDHCRWRGC